MAIGIDQTAKRITNFMVDRQAGTCHQWEALFHIRRRGACRSSVKIQAEGEKEPSETQTGRIVRRSL
jgi:hypothetical protein